MGGIISWLRGSWLALLVGVVVGRFLLVRVI